MVVRVRSYQIADRKNAFCTLNAILPVDKLQTICSRSNLEAGSRMTLFSRLFFSWNDAFFSLDARLAHSNRLIARILFGYHFSVIISDILPVSGDILVFYYFFRAHQECTLESQRGWC